MTDEMKELFEEQAKLCSIRKFANYVGYSYCYMFLLKSGKRKASQRFITDFKEGLKKMKKIKNNS